jgi:predicted DNA-binding protein
MKSIMSVNLPISLIQDMKHLKNKSYFVERAIVARLNGMENYSIRDESLRNLLFYVLKNLDENIFDYDELTYLAIKRLFEALE